MGSNPKPALLLVDDEPALLLSYRIILEQSGYQVATADSSVAARALLAERPYDLLICDLGLEAPTAGMEVVEWARKQFPSMPLLLMTGYLDEDTANRAERVGAQTVTKPIEVPRLLQILHHLTKNGKCA
jgi:DNA-binding NtrC family response regulator